MNDERIVPVSSKMYVDLLELLKPEERMVRDGALVLISPTPEGGKVLLFTLDTGL